MVLFFPFFFFFFFFFLLVPRGGLLETEVGNDRKQTTLSGKSFVDQTSRSVNMNSG